MAGSGVSSDCARTTSKGARGPHPQRKRPSPPDAAAILVTCVCVCLCVHRLVRLLVRVRVHP